MTNGAGFVGANLSFYNDKNEKLGEVAVSGDFKEGINHFTVVGNGHFKDYSSVKFHVGALGATIINPQAPENRK